MVCALVTAGVSVSLQCPVSSCCGRRGKSWFIWPTQAPSVVFKLNWKKSWASMQMSKCVESPVSGPGNTPTLSGQKSSCGLLFSFGFSHWFFVSDLLLTPSGSFSNNHFSKHWRWRFVGHPKRSEGKKFLYKPVLNVEERPLYELKVSRLYVSTTARNFNLISLHLTALFPKVEKSCLHQLRECTL